MIIKQKEREVELKDLTAGTVFRFLTDRDFYMKTDEWDKSIRRKVVVVVSLSDGCICRPDPNTKVIPYPNATLIY